MAAGLVFEYQSSLVWVSGVFVVSLDEGPHKPGEDGKPDDNRNRLYDGHYDVPCGSDLT